MHPKKPKIVVIGGGTGTNSVLTGLKRYPVELSTIVTMADDGGSTGRLRDEYGVLPPGDIRQCLVALSDESLLMRKLFNYRFDRGEFRGHNFGNIFISTLEQISGGLDKALEVVSQLLKVRGTVIPVTFSETRLVARLGNGKVLKGETQIGAYPFVSKFGIKELYLSPKPRVNPKAISAIKEADLIVVGPGNFQRSLLPNFLVPGIAAAFKKARAKKVYIANLMNKFGHTDNFSVKQYVTEFEQYVGRGTFDYVLYNTKAPVRSLLRKYAEEGEMVRVNPELKRNKKYIGKNLISSKIHHRKKGDPIARTLIRHDSAVIAKTLFELCR